MPGDRYVVLVLGRPRATWFRSVAQWATSAAIPADVLKCVSAEELRAHLDSGRPFSAILVDGSVPAVDRDLLSVAVDRGCAAIVVDDSGRAWHELGASVVLDPEFDRAQLLDALAGHARMVTRGDTGEADALGPVEKLTGSWEAPVVTVCGPGGTGTSTVAVACAQGLARRRPGGVLLADLCRRADQAMLHDVGDVIPGVQELVEIHRHRRPGSEEVRGLTFSIDARGYHLLLGLRRPRYWSALRLRSFEAAFSSMRRAWGTVVCDIEADLETEAAGGSVDVEERNLMALTAVRASGVVLVVGRGGLAGVHGLVRLVGDLVEVGVPSACIVPVVNRAPRSPRWRAEVAGALGVLTASAGAPLEVGPVFVPSRRLDDVLRDGSRFPASIEASVSRAVMAVLDRGVAGTAPAAVAPERVRPGSLGSWTSQELAEG